ncbi:MAG TPA: hypothetical protein VKX28_19760, partial [Xanthobacteraceae bacterium]|nr:hypothetical protein [Xanthobacteraceae bacterium]
MRSPDGKAEQRIELADAPLGQGATATVFTVLSAQFRGHVAKIYRKPADLSVAKIEAMIANPPQRLV